MKKLLKVSALAVSILTVATVAQAADYDINLVGASAQSKFWNETATSWLGNVNGMNCASVMQYGGKDNGAAVGTTCSPAAATNITLNATDRVVLRYRAQASVFGPQSTNGDLIVDADNYDDYTGLPCAAGEFALIDVDDAAPSNIGTNRCYNITYGSSDVSGEAFVQKSSGWIKGPNSGFVRDGSATDDYYDVGENTYSGYDTSALGNVRPVVVPFSFFVTEDVQNLDADADLSNDSITRLQAVLAFTGQAANWEDIGIDANNDPTTPTPMTVCIRHAGSGTHATLDHAVVHGDGTLLAADDITGANGPIVWFNEGSSDLTRCMSYGGTGFGLYPTPTSYAIGYADSDKCGIDKTVADATANGNSWSSKCNDGGQNIRRINYQGVEGNRENIKNCIYPFFSEQYLYFNPAEVNPNLPSTTLDYVHKNLSDYMGNPANLDALPATKSMKYFWAASNEMKCTKKTDFAFPTKK